MTIKQKKYHVGLMNHQLCFMLMIVLIVSSCKTTQLKQKTTVVSKNPVEQVIEQLKNAQPNFTTANVSKMAMEIKLSDKSFNVSVTCKIKKDSVIYFSILPFMGIELYKAELKPEGLIVFDKTNRNFYKTDYAFFSTYFGVDVDFYSLQALLFNQFFCAGAKEILVDSCKLTNLPGNKTEIDFQNSKLEQKTEISATNSIQQVVLKEKNSSIQLQTEYTDFSKVNGINFPQKITMKATTRDNQTLIDFTVLKIEFDSDIKFQSTNSDRYTQGDINQFIKKQ